MNPRDTIIHGDALSTLKGLESESVHCIVTSPPYFGLRDYKTEGQIGMEPTPAAYIETMVEVFREARRVLHKAGTLWLNLGDTYSTSAKGGEKSRPGDKNHTSRGTVGLDIRHPRYGDGIKPKDLIGIPWRLAFALQADGWYLRQDIIWSKPNPMPESVRDRCTKSHEYIFLLTKSETYFFDNEAIAEPVAETSLERIGQNIEAQEGSHRVPGKTNGPMKAVIKKPQGWATSPNYHGTDPRETRKPPRFGGNKAEGYGVRTKSGKEWNPTQGGGGNGFKGHKGSLMADGTIHLKRNKRSVWNVTTKPFKDAHFATFPPDLIEPCIKAGTPSWGTVLDPFMGAGTTGLVAKKLGRHWLGIEINEEYIRMAEKRIKETRPEVLR